MIPNRTRPAFPYTWLTRNGAAGSAEGGFVEGAQLARMQGIAAFLEQVESGKPDLQMLGNRGLVERARRPRQLDLAMQRLIGNAKQRAVGDAQAEALCRDGAALHVDGNGARQVDALPFLREAQFPIAVVVGDDGSGAQALLQRVARMPRDLGGGFLQRNLHLGQRRDRYAGRHQLVEDAILAE